MKKFESCYFHCCFRNRVFFRKSVKIRLLHKFWCITCIFNTKNFVFFGKNFDSCHCSILTFSIHSDIQNWWVVIFVIAIKEKTYRKNYIYDQNYHKNCHFHRKSRKESKNSPKVDLQAAHFFSEMTGTIDF